ncbi:mitotic spindle assembly checkpoint protein MAD1 [Anthonomus grandis grandis]|uniref:mitotic spindle assembly checkpoint protein MAD1 n=1 Tax=Anthonomus grandis grandis TaxID=2921223 RepID=UPI00216599D8|nr:mitotic spindle assembly checkpoint protein MAD1 [Anthonomus grandis grandis]
MNQTPKVNETIIKMVNNLKTTGTFNQKTDDYKTPLKRAISEENTSESSFEAETPLKRIKRENILDVSYVGSPREVRRLRFELIEARNTILNLENRIQHMHNVRKEMQVMFDSETDLLKKQHEHDRKSIEDLEEQLQSIRKREQSLKLELSQVKRDYHSLKHTTEEKTSELIREVQNLKDQSATSLLEDSVESAKIKRRILELETILQAAQEDADAQKKLAEVLAKQLEQKNELLKDLEMKEVALVKAKNRLAVLESAKEDYLEFQQQAKSQTQKLANYIELEKENEQLKEDFARLKANLKNKIVLEEEVYDLRNRLGKHKELEKKVAELQAQCDQSEMSLSEWKALARGFCETTSSDAALPQLLRSAIERLQQQELSLTSEKVSFESRLKTVEYEAKVAKTEAEKSQKLLKELKLNGEQKSTLIHRMQKKLLLLSRERDSYRLQLDSYERDLTMVANTTTSESNIMSSQKERIENLEKVVEGYRDMVAKLENDLQEAQPHLHAEVVPIRQEQITRLQDEIAKMRGENEQLREQRDRLEIQLEALSEGQDTLHGGKVFHNLANPLADCLAQRQQKLEQMQEENIKLKNKLKKMEEGIETSKIGDLSICPKEVQSLKEQIKNNEKQTQRLKDYFKSSMQDFRNVVYMLFGYKIDRPSNSSIYKLRNMYAENQDDILCFEINQEGDLNLLENDFVAKLGPMIELHLNNQKSIPVFLSAITLDLFNQKTMTKNF